MDSKKERYVLVMMILLLILFGSSILCHVFYRIQIKKIVKQLKFHNTEDSNKEIYIDCRNSEIVSLQRELNSLLKKRRERALFYANQEEELYKMITDISHDIRTPLTSVKGYFQMLEQCEKKEEKNYYREIIENRLDTISTMLDDFFTYTKTTQKELVQSVEECDVRQILCEVLFQHYDVLRERDFDIVMEIPEVSMEIVANREELCRIFMNLVKNVLVHGCERFRVRLVTQENCIIFENDTKEPLPDEIGQVFERFYKGDVARSTNLSTGLGLSIVKELVKKNNGRAEAFVGVEYLFGIKVYFDSRL